MVPLRSPTSSSSGGGPCTQRSPPCRSEAAATVVYWVHLLQDSSLRHRHVCGARQRERRPRTHCRCCVAVPRAPHVHAEFMVVGLEPHSSLTDSMPETRRQPTRSRRRGRRGRSCGLSRASGVSESPRLRRSHQLCTQIQGTCVAGEGSSCIPRRAGQLNESGFGAQQDGHPRAHVRACTPACPCRRRLSASSSGRSVVFRV